MVYIKERKRGALAVALVCSFWVGMYLFIKYTL